jgi:hypothetical protein
MDKPKGGMRARENKETKISLKNSRNKMVTNKELLSESFEGELSSDKREDKRGDAGRITTQLGTPRERYDEHSSKSFPQ